MLRPPSVAAAPLLAAALWLMGAPSAAHGHGGPRSLAQSGKEETAAAQKMGLQGAPLAEQPASAAGAVELVLGGSIDLERLDFAAPDHVHLTVGRAAGDAVALGPGSGVRFSSVRRGPSSPDDVSTWTLPKASDPDMRENRTALLRAEDSLFFVLPDGRVGRLEVRRVVPGGWELVRDLAALGQTLIPRAPDRPPGAVVSTVSGTVLFQVPKVRNAKVAAGIVHELEAEQPVGSGEWTVVQRFGPGQHQAKVEGLFGNQPKPNAIARIRVRRGFADEPLSSPGPAKDLVAAGGDPELRRQAAQISVGSLVAEDFQVRLEASIALGLLGGEARRALRAAIDGKESDSSKGSTLGALALAARERLRALDAADSGGPELDRRLGEAAQSAAQLAAFAGGLLSRKSLGEAFESTPASLVGGQPTDRAMAMLRMVDQAERGAPSAAANSDLDGAAAVDMARGCAIASAWASALSELDPDASVRQLAAFLSKLRSEPSIGAFEAPLPGWFLHGKSRTAGVEFEPFTPLREPLPAHAVDLIFELSAREELGDRRVGPALARIRAYLMAADEHGEDVSITPESGFHDYDADLVELALRLVERAVQEPLAARKMELLDAVEALLPGPALTFAAWRETSDRRWASVAGPSDARRRVVLEEADLGQLEQALLDLALDAGALGSASRVDVDILLPGGEYGEFVKSPRLLDVPGSGIRIMPRDAGSKVLIHAGFRCLGAVDFVLENVTVVHGAGQALTVMDGGHAVAIGSTLKGKGRVIHVSNGDVELYGCAALPASGDPSQGTMLQLMRGGRFLARTSLLHAGSVFIGQGGGEVWLDRCVLDSADRPMVQGQLGGWLVARESLLRGDGAGLMSVEDGMLAATVIEAAFQPMGRAGAGLRVSPRLFALIGSRDEGSKAERFAVEPLPVK